MVNVVHAVAHFQLFFALQVQVASAVFLLLSTHCLCCCDAVTAAVCSHHQQGLAVLGHSLASLRVQPPSAWLAAYLTAADTQRLAASPAGCSYLMHTLGSWRQLGCICPATQQQPARDGDAHAAAGQQQEQHQQQLQDAADALIAQCLQCFVDQGQAFTPEQLGMFCKGLAMYGLRAKPQLASVLQQVRGVMQAAGCVFVCVCAGGPVVHTCSVSSRHSVSPCA